MEIITAVMHSLISCDLIRILGKFWPSIWFYLIWYNRHRNFSFEKFKFKNMTRWNEILQLSFGQLKTSLINQWTHKTGQRMARIFNVRVPWVAWRCHSIHPYQGSWHHRRHRDWDRRCSWTWICVLLLPADQWRSRRSDCCLCNSYRDATWCMDVPTIVACIILYVVSSIKKTTSTPADSCTG